MKSNFNIRINKWQWFQKIKLGYIKAPFYLINYINIFNYIIYVYVKLISSFFALLIGFFLLPCNVLFYYIIININITSLYSKAFFLKSSIVRILSPTFSSSSISSPKGGSSYFCYFYNNYALKFEAFVNRLW